MDSNESGPPSDTPGRAAAPASPVTPGRTPPLPDDRFLGWEAGPDPTTALCAYDVEGDWELPLNVPDFSVGDSEECAISIPGRGLSARHFVLGRYGHRTRLNDLGSTHGTFFRERRLVGWADLCPGDIFAAPPMTFLLLNKEMREHRPTLFEIVGTGADRSPDWVMVQAATGSGPLLLTGGAGSDLDRLAEAIHAMSLRRSRKPVEVTDVPKDPAEQVQLVRQASKSSLILPLDENGPPFDPSFVSLLFSTSYGVRPIVLAASPDVARRALGIDWIALMQHVSVRPLAHRSGEVEKLIDRRWVTEHSFPRRFAELSPKNQAALESYGWPENFAEVRKIADAIVAYVKHGSLRNASEALGIPHARLQRLFERAGLNLNLLFGRDE